MPRVKKHKKSYIHYPIGKAGRDFKFQHVVKGTQAFGGDGRDHGGSSADSRSAFHFTNPLALYQTAQNPWCIKPAALRELLFDNLPASAQVASIQEAKRPDLFSYRYVFLVYYQCTFNIRRCRLIFDTDESHNSFEPSASDLLVSEQAMDFPCVYYWRADCSNLCNFGNALGKGMYTGLITDWNGGIDYYTPGSEDLTVKQNLFDSLRNRRWSKCVVYPKQNCGTTMAVHFNHMAPTGKLPDTTNTTLWSSLAVDVPVVQWIRKFLDAVGISGQTEMFGQASFPGDLYILMRQPELSKLYTDLVNRANDFTTAGARARLVIDYEVTTKLVLRGLEQSYDMIKFGGDWPVYS